MTQVDVLLVIQVSLLEVGLGFRVEHLRGPGADVTRQAVSHQLGPLTLRVERSPVEHALFA